MTATCNTCPRWSRADNEKGECRRHAPVLDGETAHYMLLPYDHPLWPTTRETDSCGDHPDLLTKEDR